MLQNRLLKKVIIRQDKISSDVCLTFDEMCLQKCEEYTGGRLVGAATNSVLYTGIVSFMIIGIKQNTPYIIKSLPEIKIHADWLKNEIIGCLKVLTVCGFQVRMITTTIHVTLLPVTRHWNHFNSLMEADCHIFLINLVYRLF